MNEVYYRPVLGWRLSDGRYICREEYCRDPKQRDYLRKPTKLVEAIPPERARNKVCAVCLGPILRPSAPPMAGLRPSCSVIIR